MEPTNTRPPLTPEQDRNFLGKYAYRKDEVRKPVPEHSGKGYMEDVSGQRTDDGWMYINLMTKKDRDTFTV